LAISEHLFFNIIIREFYIISVAPPLKAYVVLPIPEEFELSPVESSYSSFYDFCLFYFFLEGDVKPKTEMGGKNFYGF
jgi:hypothetical protein